mmetsp:Transcript_16151/g.50531  ORF Transcript_16151/g.50531 Transcript_16151/m.50531 type:complete len:221 (-) Transcript_16151:103-765(-)
MDCTVCTMRRHVVSEDIEGLLTDDAAVEAASETDTMPRACHHLTTLPVVVSRRMRREGVVNATTDGGGGCCDETGSAMSRSCLAFAPSDSTPMVPVAATQPDIAGGITWRCTMHNASSASVTGSSGTSSSSAGGRPRHHAVHTSSPTSSPSVDPSSRATWPSTAESTAAASSRPASDCRFVRDSDRRDGSAFPGGGVTVWFRGSLLTAHPALVGTRRRPQ